MVTIHNSDLFKEIREGTKSQQLRDGVLPTQLAEKIVPVMEVNPKLLRRPNIIINTSKSVTGASTVYTTQNAAKDFYLTNLSVRYQKDATCDAATGYLTLSCVIDGATTYLAGLPVITALAQTGSCDLNFPFPIKIDRNSALSFTGTFTAGILLRNVSLIGYYVDNPLA